jgi:hypothetical protein
MAYRITINRIDIVQTTKLGPWTTIEMRPWNEDEIADRFESPEAILKHTPLKEIKGYAPSVIEVSEKETEVLKQTVEDVDLAAVIKAINNI